MVEVVEVNLHPSQPALEDPPEIRVTSKASRTRCVAVPKPRPSKHPQPFERESNVIRVRESLSTRACYRSGGPAKATYGRRESPRGARVGPEAKRHERPGTRHSRWSKPRAHRPTAEFVAEQRPRPPARTRGCAGRSAVADATLGAREQPRSRPGGTTRDPRRRAAGRWRRRPSAPSTSVSTCRSAALEALARRSSASCTRSTPRRRRDVGRNARWRAPPHRERADRLPARGRPPFAPHADAVAVGEAAACAR